MVIELANIFENEDSVVSFDRLVATDGDCADERFPAGIVASGTVKNHCGIVTMQGKADFTFRAPCDRCAAVTERVFSVPIVHTLCRSESEEADDSIIVRSDLSLDIDGLIYEDAVLSLPTRFLCREDCKGLCPICGADRNLVDCGCQKPSDPRLAALRQLLDDSMDNSQED